MLEKGGVNILQEFATINETKQIFHFGEGVHLFVGYGHSNAVAIEGAMSVILIDTLDSPDRAAEMLMELQKITPKPVRTIIYTHGHPDHRGGAGMFQATAQSVIAFANRDHQLLDSRKINDVLLKRTQHQMGYRLNDDEAITQGIGMREGHTQGQRGYAPLLPTEIITDGIVDRVIDGVHLQLISAPGENGDMGYVWLPDQKIMCSGDNYYAAFPNLAAIRGGQYRDIGRWIQSLDLLITYNAVTVLPGHLQPLEGADIVKTTLRNYRDAIASIFDQTLAHIDAGLTVQEVVEQVRLPDHLRTLPYLQEIYGSVEWTVRAIFTAYVGWFDGNPTNLHKMPQYLYSAKMVALIGGSDKVLNALETAISEADYLWALQLCDLLIAIGETKAVDLKIKTLYALADLETSANGRHYYISYAKEMLDNK
ncbi:alkyl/aryl-sulfatase [Periweissella fabalis]|uniref:Alkyl/aryl-sulfatase n=1 Tax=Periweissella fabalis TaxID=1070421 RepID=A0A7X6N4F4_9LACO|nr:alkyl/aryl-sulfatase [Periweissella fabalis]MCM0599459.1 alkyl/aryl-sulfatase [Periweissella fabalis]NKZ23738.1 alkyl/aryl-sulfatase [Periweissella fabalis]